MRNNILICTAVVLFSAFTASAQSLSLQQCLEMASANDVYVRNAALDVEAAKLLKQEAFAEYFPGVSINAMGFHAINPLFRISVDDVLGDSDNANNLKNYIHTAAPLYGINTVYETLQYGYGATINITQPLYAGGRIVNGNRLAALGIEAARLQEDIRADKTALEVEQKYWQVVSLQEKEVTLERAITMLDTLMRDVVSLRDAGILTESEVLQVRLKQGELRKDKLRLKGGMRLAKMDLFNAIGQEYSSTLALLCDSQGRPRPFIDSLRLEGLTDSLQAPEAYYIPEEEHASSTAEASLLELNLQAKSLEKKMTLGESLPTVGIGATYGYGRYIADGSTNGIVYAMVKVPISDWGKASKKLRRLDIQITKAQGEKEYLDAQLVLRSRQRWIELGVAWEQIQLSAENVDYARRELEHMNASFEAGLVTLSELLQAQTALRQAEDSLTEDRLAYKTALATYLQ